MVRLRRTAQNACQTHKGMRLGFVCAGRATVGIAVSCIYRSAIQSVVVVVGLGRLTVLNERTTLIGKAGSVSATLSIPGPPVQYTSSLALTAVRSAVDRLTLTVSTVSSMPL
jgi:hypothetical protein